MNKQNNEFSADENSWNETLTQWISNHKQSILLSLAGFFVVLIFAAKFLMNQNADAERNYLKAEVDFKKFQDVAVSKDQTGAPELLKNLEKIIKDYPNLHAKYDAPLAQTFLIQGDVALAEPLIKETLNRTKDQRLNQFHVFSNATLLIAQKNYKAALDQSVELQNTLNLNNNETLYLFNLLRLSSLHHQLENTTEEIKSLELLQEATRSLKNSSIRLLFNEGSANFQQFLENKKNAR